jgi:hypothetical protein
MKVQAYKHFRIPSIPLYITGIYCCKLLTNFEKMYGLIAKYGFGESELTKNWTKY